MPCNYSSSVYSPMESSMSGSGSGSGSEPFNYCMNTDPTQYGGMAVITADSSKYHSCTGLPMTLSGFYNYCNSQGYNTFNAVKTRDESGMCVVTVKPGRGNGAVCSAHPTSVGDGFCLN